MLTQGKDDNEAGRKKDKQETANPGDREYKTTTPSHRVVVADYGRFLAKNPATTSLSSNFVLSLPTIW